MDIIRKYKIKFSFKGISNKKEYLYPNSSHYNCTIFYFLGSMSNEFYNKDTFNSFFEYISLIYQNKDNLIEWSKKNKKRTHLSQGENWATINIYEDSLFWYEMDLNKLLIEYGEGEVEGSIPFNDFYEIMKIWKKEMDLFFELGENYKLPHEREQKDT